MRRGADDTVPIDRIGERLLVLGVHARRRMIIDQSRARLNRFSKECRPATGKLIELRFFEEYLREIAAELQLPDGHGQNADYTARANNSAGLYYGKRIALKPHPFGRKPFSYPLIPCIPNLLDRKSPHKADDPADTASVESPTQDRHAA